MNLNIEEKQETVDFTSMERKAVEQCYAWYEPDKNAKHFYIEEMKEMYKLYIGEHWDLIGPGGRVLRTPQQQQNRPNSVENVTFSLVEGTASEFAQDTELLDYPVEPGDEEAANVMTNLKKFIFYKNRHPKERIKFLRYFFLYGTGIWHTYWDPDWKGGKGPNRWIGDIRWRALHPMALVPDARCKEDINEGNRCHKVTWHTIESVKERYPDKAGILQDQTMEEDDVLGVDVFDDEGFTDSEYRQNQIPVIETWYIGKPLIPEEGEEETGEIGLHVIWWAGESQRIYLKHVNYIYFEPGETPAFPFIVAQCYPRENSIWGFGEAYFLKNPQIVRNKTAEIIMEGHLHHALGQTWYEDNALTPKQQKTVQEKGTLPGMWFGVKSIAGIKREYGQGVPASLQSEMNRIQSVMESIIGRFDISQGRTPGSVTAFKAIAELSARAQVRLRIKEMAITDSYEKAGTYTNRLIAENYTEQRKFRIMGDDGHTYGTYRQEDMLKVYDQGTGEVMPFNQVNPETLNPETHEVYFPDFDSYCRTSSVQPADRFYNIEIAKELLQMGIIDVITFFKVMDTGKFPPIEEMQQQIEQQQAQQQQQMLAQQAMRQGSGRAMQPQEQPPMPEQEAQSRQLLEFAQYLEQNRPDLMEAIRQLPEGQREMALMELMQQLTQEAQGGQQQAAPLPQQPERDIESEAEILADTIINLLPQEVQAYLASLPPEQRYAEIQSILQMLAERGILQEAMGGVQGLI
ncbi:MAG TPA: hypothetical protein PK684_01105 [Bacillota bacterium]|nr:hypothetical protein [Bacillota bacterium]